MYKNYEQFMYVLEQSMGMGIKYLYDVIYDLGIGGKSYDLIEEGEEYLLWTSEDSTDELLVEYDLDKPIRLQSYCIRSNEKTCWGVMDLQEEIYCRKLKQNIIGYREALERIYEYDVMELVEMACDSLKPGYKDGYAILDLTNGKVRGISLEDQTMLEPKYAILYMVAREEFECSFFEELLEGNENDNFDQSGMSVEEWMDNNEFDWYSRLVDLIFLFFNQDREEYELWERDLRSRLDNWYSDYYDHPEKAIK